MLWYSNETDNYTNNNFCCKHLITLVVDCAEVNCWMRTNLFSAYQHVQRIRGVSRNALRTYLLTYLLTYFTLRCMLFSSVYAHHRCQSHQSPVQPRQLSPIKKLGANVLFFVPVFLLFSLCMPISLEIYCTFLLIFSASGKLFSPDHFFIIWPRIQNGTTRMMLTQVQNTSRASGSVNV